MNITIVTISTAKNDAINRFLRNEINASHLDVHSWAPWQVRRTSRAGSRDHVRLRPCLEDPNRYLLLVRWARLEDHTEGFRGSDRYQDWKAALHHFYQPFPSVEHYGPPL